VKSQLALGGIGLLLQAAAGAQMPQAAAAPRDPMRSPAAIRAAAPEAAAAPPTLVARHLLMIEGRRYVIEGGQRRAVGDLLGAARIVAIEDHAVTVRSGTALVRLPLFPGVLKQAAVDPMAAQPLPAPRAAPVLAAGSRTAAARAASTPDLPNRRSGSESAPL
jgi:hypothetical protein